VAERTVNLVLQKLGRGPVACRTGDTPLPGAGLNDADPSDPVAHAIRDEMAQTLVDVVVRRTGLGAVGHPGERVANEVAGRMRETLGWSEDRTRREIEALQNFYRVV
jgi:glycerol-3-phosphate dehydrogenase